MIEGSRLGSVQTVQGLCVSMLPQVLQTSTLSSATCRAPDSGIISASRFLIRCSAARRAERGPRPGSRARSWTSRSISGPATAPILLAEQPRRQAEPAGERLHLLLHRRLCLAAGIAKGGDEQVLQHFLLFRLHQRGIDLDALDVHLRGHAHGDETAAGNAFDLYVGELLLHLLHLGLQLRRLLHHAEEISHGCSSLKLAHRSSAASEPSGGSSEP